jgi:hypothetical protein
LFKSPLQISTLLLFHHAVLFIKLRAFVSSGRGSEFPLPILELGIYGLLLHLKKLLRLTLPGLPMAISKLAQVEPRGKETLSLQSLCFNRDLLTEDEFVGVARRCGSSLVELNNVSPLSAAPLPKTMQPAFTADADSLINENSIGAAAAAGDSNFSAAVCNAMQHFSHLTTFNGRMSFACFLAFAERNGRQLTKIHLSSVSVFNLGHFLLLRKFAPNLQRIEGSFLVHAATVPLSTVGGGDIDDDDQGFQIPNHNHFSGAAASNLFCGGVGLGSHVGPFSSELLDLLLVQFPMRQLRAIDVEGRLTLMAMQLLTGGAERLEELHITNAPPLESGGGGGSIGADAKALSDEWVDALIRVNHLSCVRNLTLRMDSTQTADVGMMTERGLTRLLDHCLEHCHKIGEVVGEFTRIPDIKLVRLTTKYVEMGLHGLRVRNAIPYRSFDNEYDSDRHYGLNEGYRSMLQRQQAAATAANGGVQQNSRWRRGHAFGGGGWGQDDADTEYDGSAAADKRRGGGERFKGYVFRPFEDGKAKK